MKRARKLFMFIQLALFLCASAGLHGQTKIFDYSRSLFGTPTTITLTIQSLNASTGVVTVNGGDSQAPPNPFMWIWGDGTVTSGYFPQAHTYTNATKNYLLKVIATYPGGTTDSSTTVIRFAASSVNPIVLSPDIAVTIPASPSTLTDRSGGSFTMQPFVDRFFTTTPRSTIAYVLSVASAIDKDFVNDNVFLYNSKFEQVMLRDSSYNGAYSMWYTNPVAFGVGDVFFQGTIGYSSFFHEMGHNYTLNIPASYYYGGRIDGNANAVYSESMAQIFAHAAGYEIVNNYQHYGLSDDLMWDIRSSLLSSMDFLRTSYNGYIGGGKKFASWNDPATPSDETLNTFMTIAYKFCEQAENVGQGYRIPLKRMMRLLQGFNSSWSQRYDQSHNTVAADTFRATLMTTAVSYAFAKDLRSDFRNLNFPISDKIYAELYNGAAATAGTATTVTQISGNYQNANVSTALVNPFIVSVTDAGGNPIAGVNVTFGFASTPSGATGQSLSSATTTTNISGQASCVLTLGSKVGTYSVTGTSSGLSGSPVTFTATATTGAASAIIIASGDVQTALFGTPLSNPMVVTVQDAGGNPVSGVSVNFAIASVPTAATGQSLSNTTSLSNSNGQASSVLTLGNKAGSYTVAATSALLTGRSVTFAATATNPSPTLTAISTNRAGRGSRINMTVAGTNFLQGVTAVSYGSDITVNSSVWNSVNQIAVNISISSNAVTGGRDVTVTNPGPGGGTATLAGGFTIDTSPATFVESTMDAVPEKFILCDAYPSPFNPSTTIRYGVPDRSIVKLGIYNALGELVTELFSGETGQGYHEVRWSARNAASGVYFVRLQAESMARGELFVSSRKLVLVK